jgi:hypothetical protein
MHSLLARNFVQNIALRFWSVYINITFTNVGRRTMCCGIRSFYEGCILKTNRFSTGKSLSGTAFCWVCWYFSCAPATMHYRDTSFCCSVFSFVPFFTAVPSIPWRDSTVTSSHSECSAGKLVVRNNFCTFRYWSVCIYFLQINFYKKKETLHNTYHQCNI